MNLFRLILKSILHFFWPCDDTFNDEMFNDDNMPAVIETPEPECKDIPKIDIQVPVKLSTDTIEIKARTVRIKTDIIEIESKIASRNVKVETPEPERKYTSDIEIKAPVKQIEQPEAKPELKDEFELEKGYLNLLFESEPIERRLNHLTIYSASYFYTGMRAIIHRFKYEGAKNLCVPLGRAMSMLFTKPEIDLLIPVPLHVNSTRKYNQSYELAKGMSEFWDIKVIEAAEWANEIEHRVGLNAHERMKLKADDFRITHDVHGLRVSVVDDVCTTGATLLRLSEALEKAGANVVCAYALSVVSE